jgi:hypothetical protein
MAPDDLLTYQHSVKLGEIMGFFKTCKERDKAEGETPSDIPLAVAAMLSKVTGSTQKFYMLANQLPLLELGALANPVSNTEDGISDRRPEDAIFYNFRANPFYRLLATINKMKDEEAVKILSAGPITSGPRETPLQEIRRIREDFKELEIIRKLITGGEKHRLGLVFEKFCQNVDTRITNRTADDNPAYFTRRLCATAGKPYELIEFSDPNDMLSYRFPDRYHAAAKEFYTKPFKPVDVELNIAVPWLGIFADPIQAHTGHQSDETVLDFMVNGRSKSRDPQKK